MTLNQFEIYLENLQKFMADQTRLSEVVRVISPSSTGVVEFGSEFIDDYINLLSEAIGDYTDFVSWFVFENEFGAKGLEAGPTTEDLKPIKTARDLWEWCLEKE